MCGIAGLIFNELQPDGAAWLTAMTQTMFHRGPDDGGAVVFGLGGRPTVERRLGRPKAPVQWDYLPMQVGLGARRLAILDTSDAAHQPMCGGDGQAWLVFNGAIYNYRELRAELSAAGMAFRSEGDTEVLLAAYRHWGMEAFGRLEGMWACAIYEPAAGRVVLCRDRFGIKPLHVAKLEKGIAFASEIKAICSLPGFRRETEASLLRDFLARGLVDHTDRTLFERVWSVPPGCWIRFELRGGQGGMTGSIGRYWAAPREVEDGGEGAFDAAAAIREALRASVSAHLVSDVPVGSCLSGGLDSSAIVAMVHEAADAPHWSRHTFTACLPGEALDERRYAESVVAACAGVEGHYVTPTAEALLGDMMSFVWHQEQPFGSPSIYMQWRVMRAAHEAGVKVLLDGQGADELLCGYEGCIPPMLASMLRRGHFGAACREWRGAVREGWYRRGSLAGHLMAHLLPDATRDRLRLARARGECDWLSRELFDVSPGPDIRSGLSLASADAPDGVDPGGGFVSRMVFSESLPALLRFEDRSSMAFSVEARVPYLDRAVFDVAMRTPVEMKLKEGRLKAILREAVGELLPEEVRNRRDKIGFAAPTAAWMRGALRAWWEEALNSQKLRDRGCFAPKGVARLASRFNGGDDSAAPAIWRVAVVETWARRFMDHGTS